MERRHNGPRRPGGPHGPMGTGERAKDFKGALRKLMKLMAQYKWSLIAVIALSVGSALFSIIGPKKMGEITTVIFSGLMSRLRGGEGVDYARIGALLLWLLGLYVLSAALSFAQHVIMTGVSQKLSYNLRKQLAAKVHRLPMSYFDHVTHGDVLSRVTNDVDTLGQSLNQSLSQIVSSATTAVGVLAMMLSISWQMTLITLCILPLSAILMGLVVKKSQKYFVGQQKYLGEANGQVEEIFSGHVVVKAFNAQDDAAQEFDRTNAMLYRSAWKSQFLSGLMQPITSLIGNLGYVAAVVLGSGYAASGAITVGDIQSFIQYVRSFNQPVSQVAQIANILQSTMAASERVFEFLEESEEEQTVPNPVSIEGIQGEVTFDHVRFGYTPERTIIHDFSATVKPGQKIAIVGPTGAGKTTMVKLLMRFYDVTGGRILIDGHDIRDFDRDQLRLLFGMVLQDTWLFGGSIAENIRYGRLDATDEEVVAAARAAHAHHFIKTQAGGYQMEINEESSNISQGQKQLLTIARAILADPKIMILDEATSSVDTRTEARIQKGMDESMKGRTSFIIAHRLSTIRNADLILVMKDGDIVEQGTHEELLAKGGFYKELYQAQFENAAA
ncbi:MAG: ABC transporter ATP-binding protein [Eubacteriales bacterium]|nr:ABC transporter ATP-binding protein [Eubacteriales bacterium]MDY4009102.1 ABC transporter ATP-binding protein [Candidatus Limiplasma sp.]